MNRTFEELASQEIDRLYQGALFLTAGKAEAAESLLLSTLTAAFHAFRTMQGGADTGHWLEGRLVRTFLSTIPDSQGEERSVRAPQRTSASLTVPAEVDPATLFNAAIELPERARAALWLVLFRRWRYSEASDMLGTDLDDLRELLGYRRLILTAVLGSGDERDGTNGDSM